MQSSQGKKNKNSSEQKPFAPFVAKTLQGEGYDGFDGDFITYNEKYNLIITCSTGCFLHFYNATTLLPSEEFKTSVLDRKVWKMTCCVEAETFLFQCHNGEIYAYNFSKKTLEQLIEQPIGRENYRVTFMNYSYDSVYGRVWNNLCFYNLENGHFFSCPLKYRDDLSNLEDFSKKNVLFSSFQDGSVMINRINELPKLPILYSVQGNHGGLARLKRIMINKRDFILTTGDDCVIRIWSLTKGKMRLIKVISLSDKFYSMVYLESCKMFAVTHFTHFMSFLHFPSGKLECMLNLNMRQSANIFLMKEKNSIGVLSFEECVIKIIGLQE